MQTVVEAARVQLAGFLQQENTLDEQVQRGQPEFTHNMNFRSPTKGDLMKTIVLGQRAFEEILASRIFKEK